MRRLCVVLLWSLTACSAAPPWRPIEMLPPLEAQREGSLAVPMVVYFALPGREQSERMAAQALPDPLVTAALSAAGFDSCSVDGFALRQRYDEWVGGGEGMGIVVLDEQRRVLAARPGPQDAPELAAFVELVADRRPAIAAARAALQQRPDDPELAAALGEQLLELGCRQETRTLLQFAAHGGVPRAAARLARLYALDGHLRQARQWLARAPAGPQVAVTEGYVLFKERRYVEAAAVLRAALDGGGLGDEQARAQLFCGKALHESGRQPEAVRELHALIAAYPGSTFAGAALHTLQHIRNPDHGHSH